MRNKIEDLFLQNITAIKAAKKLRINKKTILRYYTLIRESIANIREEELRKRWGDFSLDESDFFKKAPSNRNKKKVPALGLINEDGEVVVFFSKNIDSKISKATSGGKITPHSWVYADDITIVRQFNIRNFRYIKTTPQYTSMDKFSQYNILEGFWEYAVRCLNRYHGGFKNNFSLFMREVEFRFNHRDDTDAFSLL